MEENIQNGVVEETIKVKKVKVPSTIVTSAMLAIVGLLLLIQPGQSLDFICRILGAIVLVAGIIEILFGIAGRTTMMGTSNIIMGGIVSVVGIVILARPDILVSLLPFVAGIVITAHGATSLIKSFQLIGAKDKYWWLGLLLSLVTVGFGLLLFFKSYEAAEFTARIVGIFLIYSGVSHLWISYRRARAAKMRRQEEAALDVEAKVVDAE